MMKRHGVLICFSAALLLAGCNGFVPEYVFEPSYFDLPAAAYFPAETNIPQNNRLSVQGVELGKKMFSDPFLSSSGHISCASCHIPEKGYGGGTPDIPTSHAVLPLINVAYNTQAFGWNGEAAYPQKNVEDVIASTLTDAAEMNNHKDSLTVRLQKSEDYPPLFKEAFGSEHITYERICMALAQYVRTLTAANSKFDRYMRGEDRLSDEEMRGYVLFTTEEGADCFHCHGGSGNVLFTNYRFEVNGLDEPDAMNDELDRRSVSNREEDRGAYRVPTLRNIAKTAPYMHDGRFATLDEVIDQYSEGVKLPPNISPLMHHAAEGGVQLTPAEKQALKAFLLTLSEP